MEQQTLDRPVGQLVAEKPSRSRVFERWGIDYCCGGKQTLSAACADRNLDISAVAQDLEALERGSEPKEADLRTESLTALCDHIQTVHHGYLRENLPRLTALTDRVADRHGDKDPRLVEVREVFREFRHELESHTAKEDQILFPAIRGLEAHDGTSHFGPSIATPIQTMLAEHDDARIFLEKLRSLTDGFRPSPSACNTWRAMLAALAELEADMHQHIHKENNILFPRAIQEASGA